MGLPCCPGDRGHRDGGDRDSSDRGRGDGALRAKRAAIPGETGQLWSAGSLSGTDEVSTSVFQVPLAPLDTLCSWMDGMEELQASQGPPAADAALAASQLREQEVQGQGIGTGRGILSSEPQAKPLANNSGHHVLEYTLENTS